MKRKLILGLTLCVSSVHASHWEIEKNALCVVGAGAITYVGSGALTSLSPKQRAVASALVAICVGLSFYYHKVLNQSRVTDVHKNSPF